MSDIVALITARGGSKGLPGKNVRPLKGQPLIQWTVEAAVNAPSVDEVIVSSDCPDIIEAATGAGAKAPFTRPAELAGDDTPHLDVVLHALDFLEGEGKLPEALLLLQPTCPLRSTEDIESAIRLFREQDCEAVVSVTRSESHPYLTYRMTAEARLEPFMTPPSGYLRRQDLPDVYSLNGAIYLNRVTSLRSARTFLPSNTCPLVMPRERSIDIDTLEDFALAEFYLDRTP
jgi:CMP-N,N'-diacetyllegionaminic acid synthase